LLEGVYDQQKVRKASGLSKNALTSSSRNSVTSNTYAFFAEAQRPLVFADPQ